MGCEVGLDGAFLYALSAIIAVIIGVIAATLVGAFVAQNGVYDCPAKCVRARVFHREHGGPHPTTYSNLFSRYAHFDGRRTESKTEASGARESPRKRGRLSALGDGARSDGAPSTALGRTGAKMRTTAGRNSDMMALIERNCSLVEQMRDELAAMRAEIAALKSGQSCRRGDGSAMMRRRSTEIGNMPESRKRGKQRSPALGRAGSFVNDEEVMRLRLSVRHAASRGERSEREKNGTEGCSLSSSDGVTS